MVMTPMEGAEGADPAAGAGETAGDGAGEPAGDGAGETAGDGAGETAGDGTAMRSYRMCPPIPHPTYQNATICRFTYTGNVHKATICRIYVVGGEGAGVGDELETGGCAGGSTGSTNGGCAGNTVVVVVGITGGSPSASMSSPYTHTAVLSGISPEAQIMSIAATLTRTQPCDAG